MQGKRALPALRPAPSILIVFCGILLGSCALRGARLLERGPGLICYTAPDGNLHVTDQAGRSDHAITSDAGSQAGSTVVYGFASWSPDGTGLAFARHSVTDSGAGVANAIYAWHVAGGGATPIFESSRIEPFYLCWSPDSIRLSVLSSVPEDGSLELGILKPATGGGYEALDHGSPYYWDWLADGTSLVAHVNSGGTGEERLSLLRLDAQPSRTDIPVGPALFQAPDVSPDGRTVAYVSETPDGFSLRVRSLDGSGEREVANGSGGVYFSIARDGKRIAFLAAESVQPVPQGTLSIADLQGTGSVATLPAESVLAFFWSPDGRTLAYLVPDSSDGIDAAFLRDEQASYVRLAGYDPASRRSWTIARFPISAGMATLLPFFDQYLRSDTIWSPNGRFITFSAYAADGLPALFVARGDGNLRPRKLAAGDWVSWSPR